MDILFYLHLLIVILIISIPFWPNKYLSFGVYIPLLISLCWVIFNGCPVTKYQNLKTNSFTQELYNLLIPNISKDQTIHINVFLLLSITVIGFTRLKCKNLI